MSGENCKVALLGEGYLERCQGGRDCNVAQGGIERCQVLGNCNMAFRPQGEKEMLGRDYNVAFRPLGYREMLDMD